MSLITAMRDLAMAMKVTTDERDLYLHKLATAGQTEIFEGIFSIWDLQPDSRGPYMDINCRDENGNTVLHVAASHGDLSLVSLLLKKGVDVNAKNNQGRSALVYATYNEDPGVIDALLQAGAEINSSSNAGLLPLDYAAQSGKLEAVKKLVNEGAEATHLENYRSQLLHSSVAANDIELTNMLCPRDLGDEIEQSQFSDSERRFLELETLVVKLGASVQITDKLGRSAVHIAARLGYSEVLRIILGPGPGVETLANEQETITGKAPLHFAVEANHEAVIDILLEAGADPLQPDRHGVTPIKLSASLDHASLVQKLVANSSRETLSREDKSVDFASFIFGDAGPPVTAPVLVPLLCYDDLLRDDCRGTQWLDFHIRRGWALTDTFAFKKADGSQHTREELSAFLQSWLFFGLLQALLDIAGVKFNWRKLLYEDESGVMKVTTRHLPYYLHEWSLKCHFLPKQKTDLMDNILRIAATMFVPSFSFRGAPAGASDCKERKPSHKETAETVIPEVALSIFILGEILMGYRHEMRDKKAEREEAKAEREQAYKRKVMRHLGLSDPAENTSAPHEEPRSAQAGSLDSKNVEFWHKPFSQSPFVTYDMMLANHWCKSDANILHTFGLGPTGLYYMSRLDRRRPRADHNNCTDHRCKVHNVNETTYRTEHVDPQCGCDMIRVDEDTVTSVVMSGNTPVICICTDGPPEDQEVHLEVTQGLGRYITVSHVWADGLGNPKSNSLPKCQLLRLKALLNNASTKGRESSEVNVPVKESSSRSIGFWLDTLCIPLQKPARSKALHQLSDVYRNSSATLVLDKELMNTSAAAPRTELLARMIMSTWMRRLWTFEEGLLSAGKLIFQFRETCLGYTEELHEMFDLTTSDIYLRQLHDSISNCFYGSIPSTWDMSRKYELHRLNTLALGLASRTTSNPADEFKCLGSLLELDVEKIAEASDEERPYVFYSQLGDKSSKIPGISPSILFAAGPRLTRPGFHWAPRSFLGRTPREVFDLKFGRIRTEDYSSHITADYSAGIGLPTRETDDDDETAGLVPAYCGKRGLHVKLAAWVIELSPRGPFNVPFAFTDAAAGVTYMIWQVDLERGGSKEAWSDRARLAVLHHPAFDPWAVLVSLSFPDWVAGPSSVCASPGPDLEQYGIYLGLVRFTRWPLFPDDRENSTQKLLQPSFYCAAKKSLVEHWCID